MAGAEVVPFSRRKCTILVRWSTTTKVELCPWYGRYFTMKSIVNMLQGHVGTGRECRMLEHDSTSRIKGKSVSGCLIGTAVSIDSSLSKRDSASGDQEKEMCELVSLVWRGNKGRKLIQTSKTFLWSMETLLGRGLAYGWDGGPSKNVHFQVLAYGGRLSAHCSLEDMKIIPKFQKQISPILRQWTK